MSEGAKGAFFLAATPLAAATGPRFGGKAAGLASLIAAGLQVPNGFVVKRTPAPEQTGTDFSGIDRACKKITGLFAVRSSATAEDGSNTSAAGQYDTFLHVDPGPALHQAIDDCFASLDSDRADAYFAGLENDVQETNEMAVVVQQMIRGRVSGVLFTVPPDGRKDRMLLEMVEGDGEQLVSGHANAISCELPREGPVTEDTGMLSAVELTHLRDQAILAETHFGHPLDMEWTVDGNDELHWLQARPITTGHGPTAHEFDYEAKSDQYFTRVNVGEMLPGAATPLTISIFGKALNHSMHTMYANSGALTREHREDPFAVTFSNHFFLNLTRMYDIVARVAGTSHEALEVSLFGREMTERPDVKKANPFLRISNFFKYGGYIMKRRKAIAALEKIQEAVHIPSDRDPTAQLAHIAAFLPTYNLVMALHMQVSSYSGAMNGGLRTVLQKGGLSTAQQMEAIGNLLLNIEGIESAQIIKSLGAIGAAVCAHEHARALPPDDLLAWLCGDGKQSKAGQQFSAFLRNHGHRCVREVELREKEWREDRNDLVHSIANMACAQARHSPSATLWQQGVDAILENHSGVNKGALRYFVKRARQGVKEREYTKSILIRMTSRIRAAVRRLGDSLVAAALLEDSDLTYFLTVSELQALCAGDAPDAAIVAKSRRQLQPAQSRLRFPDFSKGAPVAQSATPIGGTDSLNGLPVSPGLVQGLVRIIDNKEDAKALQEGEIMCARFTDVGWTPYYGIAGGMVTEIGSSLSHGAVVAREYGLPLVSSVEDATLHLRTGDFVELDGTTGTLRVLKATGS